MAEESDDGGVMLKALIGDMLDYCDPHIVSGGCCFIHNVFLAYPDYMAAYLHHTSFLVQLTRCSGCVHYICSLISVIIILFLR